MKLGSTVFILGAGGFANELKTYIQNYVLPRSPGRYRDQRPDPLSFTIYLVADNGNLTIKQYHHKINSIQGSYYSIMGSGHCHVKDRMLKEIRGPILSYIHPTAIVLNETTIGKGSVVAPGSVIAPRAVLGEHVLANYNCTVGHDTTIGDLSVIGPNAAVGGNCTIGNRVYIGSGACIKENITIHDGSVVGMGSVVIKDVLPNETVVGVPAKPLKR